MLNIAYTECTKILAKVIRCLDKLHYLDAGVYGTDEQDVGKYDEDTNVDSQHNWGAARKK